jgi:malonyl-CoA/methylmalonyl-CoA synthetase
VNLYQLLRSRFPDDPDAVCLETENAVLTFGELDAATARLQALLRERGVAPGDRVAAQVEKSPQAVSLYLACLRSGAVYVPLNPAYTDEEVLAFLADAEPALFVCDPARRASLEPGAIRAGVAQVLTQGAQGEGSLAAALDCAPDTRVEERDDGDLAALLYTSGTTGRAKGAMLSHGNLASNALTLHACWRFVPGDVLLHALPLYHAHGLFVALHCALLNGSRTLFVASFDAQRVALLLPRATVFMGVPTHYTRLLARPELDREACRGVRLFVSGSAPLLAATHRAFAARTGHRILERYGMTETGMIASNPCDGERVAGTVGFALPGVEVRVAGDGGGELPRGETGELWVRGPNVFSGYWRLPERTRAELRDDGFFATGDLAVMAEDGRVTLVGRARDLIISGGLNVYPVEVERLIDAIPGVAESAVIGAPHPDFGEGVTAVVVLDGSCELDEGDLLARLADRLARYKQPKRAVFVEALPRNAMGKIEKGALRERFAALYAPAR